MRAILPAIALTLAGCGSAPVVSQTAVAAPGLEVFRAAIAPLYMSSPCPLSMPAALAARDLALLRREEVVRGKIQRDPEMWAQARIVLAQQAEAAKGMSASECEGLITTFSAAEVREYAALLDTRERELLGAERAVNSFNSKAG